MMIEKEIGWELSDKKPPPKRRGSQHIRRVEKHEIKRKIIKPKPPKKKG